MSVEDITGVSPEDVFERALGEARAVGSRAQDAARVFTENVGTMYPLDDARVLVSSSLDVDPVLANRLIVDLVEDLVDPVTAVRTSGGLYVGVAEYDEGPFFYEYREFHDVIGPIRRSVCAACVDRATFDHEVVAVPSLQRYRAQERVAHATEGMGSLGVDSRPEDRYRMLARHYVLDHTDLGVEDLVGEDVPDDLPDETTVADLIDDGLVDPVAIVDDHDLGGDVQTGASLVSGTTIASNTALHGGNLSSFDASSFDGSSGSDGQVLTSTGAAAQWEAAPGGGIIANFEWTEDDTRTTESVGSGNWSSDIFTMNYTPLSSTAEVIFFWSVSVDGKAHQTMRVRRDGTLVMGASTASGSTDNGTMGSFLADQAEAPNHSGFAVDTPGTTSQVTYQLSWHNAGSGTRTLKKNRGSNTGDSDRNAFANSVMAVLEMQP